MTGSEIAGALIREREIMPELFEACILQYMQEYEFRIYKRPAKVDGHPVGYLGAETYKIIKIKKKEKSK